MSGAQLIIACLLLPAAGAAGIALAGRRARLQAGLAFAAAALLLAAVLGLLPTVWVGGVPQLFVLEMLPGVALGFRIEPLGMLFALASALAWLVACWRSRRAPRAWHALAAAAAIGMAFAANAATLVLFGAMLTPLTRLRLLPAALAAALLLCALAGTWALAGTLEFLPGGVVHGGLAGPALAVVAALYLLGLGAWALAPGRQWTRAAAAVFALLKLGVYVFGVPL
jgi:multicomponent Na+:H+ antiporter subunit D